jgi:hypothetical protein
MMHPIRAFHLVLPIILVSAGAMGVAPAAADGSTKLQGGIFHKPIIVRPGRIGPASGLGPVSVTAPKPPSPYVCPGGVEPNLPCGTPITNSAPGYTSCTFLNGVNDGCDIYPMPTGSAVGGEQPGGHNHHHLN